MWFPSPPLPAMPFPWINPLPPPAQSSASSWGVPPVVLDVGTTNTTENDEGDNDSAVDSEDIVERLSANF